MWKDLLAQGKFARLCHLAARLIMVLGLATAAVEVYLIWSTYQRLIQLGLAPGSSGAFLVSPDSSPYVRMIAGSSVSWLDLTGPLAFLFGTIATTIFYSLLLTLIGHILSAFASARPASAGARAETAQAGLSEDEPVDGLIFQSLDEVEAGERSRGGRGR
ncbi:MAG: hypothetical protein IRZ31_21320 [Thermogemmatispora sp.]|uniref:hypothetical protein n=1 Tax=Thermogemmatispora sp. TaxID=1968838 RepID=UPI00260CAAA3|nr:hypothetical protein [Thermogemmatispora sp.]MBX5459439.1 hypothetical protein [Thermogemmatispora sp.]